MICVDGDQRERIAGRLEAALSHERVDFYNVFFALGHPLHEKNPDVHLFEEVESTAQCLGFCPLDVHLHNDLLGLEQRDEVVHADGLYCDGFLFVFRHAPQFEVYFGDVQMGCSNVVAEEINDMKRIKPTNWKFYGIIF